MLKPLIKYSDPISSSNPIDSYQNDHLGVPQLIHTKEGLIVSKNNIKPFGIVSQFISIEKDNLVYPGQYKDDESGLFYNYHRYYDPTIGRYIQRDPIGMNGGINEYNYADSNPLINYDDMGLKIIIRPGYKPRLGGGVYFPPGGGRIVRPIPPLILPPSLPKICGGCNEQPIPDTKVEKICKACDPKKCNSPSGQKFNKVTHWESHNRNRRNGRGYTAGGGSRKNPRDTRVSREDSPPPERTGRDSSHGCLNSYGRTVHWHYDANRQYPPNCECKVDKHNFGGCGPASAD